VPQEVLETLAKDMPRVIKWDVMISEGTIFVTDDRGQHEVQLAVAGRRTRLIVRRWTASCAFIPRTEEKLLSPHAH
jgi:hypothetical protein